VTTNRVFNYLISSKKKFLTKLKLNNSQKQNHLLLKY